MLQESFKTGGSDTDKERRINYMLLAWILKTADMKQEVTKHMLHSILCLLHTACCTLFAASFAHSLLLSIPHCFYIEHLLFCRKRSCDCRVWLKEEQTRWSTRGSLTLSQTQVSLHPLSLVCFFWIFFPVHAHCASVCASVCASSHVCPCSPAVRCATGLLSYCLIN